MKIGLFFGSFNPVHTGHMIIANFLGNHTDIDEVWLVVTPQNPLKQKSNLAPDHVRLDMVRLAIGDHPGIKASDIEFSLPIPSYTIDTLKHLDMIYPDHQFVLVMGGDNLKIFHKWKAYEQILEQFEIYVYKRPGYRLGPLKEHASVTILNAPQLMISATYIRENIKLGKSVRYLVPEAVNELIMSKKLYQ
ncbi:MAG: nicotinate (nicotinamide) nucleotide adenylyltransferase [Bacteroidota bacterium]